MAEVGRTLIGVGILLVVLGGVLVLAGRIPWLGRLPGDVVVERGPVTVYLPIVTCLVLSVALTILAHLFGRR